MPNTPDWNSRFGEAGFAYGVEPNEFLASVASRIPEGRVLCLAEGEGRNAVYLAQLGYEVTAVDLSDVGLAKARRLASKRGVSLRTEVADLGSYDIEAGAWSAIVSIFCHIPPAARQRLHKQVAQGLQTEGLFILEAYTPDQCPRETGGPGTPETTMTLELLQKELSGLTFQHAIECERDIHEGKYHTGIGAVVQVVAKR